jgi:type VII secretion effector (TIGR04197 family)
MSEVVIQVSKEAVAASQADIKQGTSSLDIQDINFAVRSNLTAVQTAKIAYSGASNLLSSIKEILQADAEHIGQMGEEFSAVDERPSLLLAD